MKMFMEAGCETARIQKRLRTRRNVHWQSSQQKPISDPFTAVIGCRGRKWGDNPSGCGNRRHKKTTRPGARHETQSGEGPSGQPVRVRRLNGKAIERGPLLGRAIAVRRAALERSNNLTRPLDARQRNTAGKLCATVRRSQRHTPNSKGKNGRLADNRRFERNRPGQPDTPANRVKHSHDFSR